MTLKIAVLAPIPRPSVRMNASENPGMRGRVRSARRISLNTAAPQSSPCPAIGHGSSLQDGRRLTSVNNKPPAQHPPRIFAVMDDGTNRVRLQLPVQDVPELDLERRSDMHLKAEDSLGRGLFGIFVDRDRHQLAVDELQQDRAARDDVI